MNYHSITKARTTICTMIFCPRRTDVYKRQCYGSRNDLQNDGKARAAGCDETVPASCYFCRSMLVVDVYKRQTHRNRNTGFHTEGTTKSVFLTVRT